jgi:hypothetical protein
MNNEPVAWMEANVLPLTHIIKAVVRREQDEQHTIPLYTHPAKTLTDEEIQEIAHGFEAIGWMGDTTYEFARAILRKANK